MNFSRQVRPSPQPVGEYDITLERPWDRTSVRGIGAEGLRDDAGIRHLFFLGLIHPLLTLFVETN